SPDPPSRSLGPTGRGPGRARGLRSPNPTHAVYPVSPARAVPSSTRAPGPWSPHTGARRSPDRPVDRDTFYEDSERYRIPRRRDTSMTRHVAGRPRRTGAVALLLSAAAIAVALSLPATAVAQDAPARDSLRL